MKKREILIPVILTDILSSIVYLLFQLFPYGELTLAWCDARQQVVPLLLDLKDMLCGEQSVFLNLQNAGGMDMWGVLFFFVTSPLHLLTAFVPDEGMFGFFNILVVMKLMLCAASAYWFFRKKFSELGVGLASALALMYAFCGFNMMFYQNVIWLDTAYLFPVLLMGLDRLLREGKPGLYIGVLCAELFVNYYMSYMVVLFLLIGSGLYLCMCCSRAERRRGALLFILSSAVAACLTACIWLPCLGAYLESARGSNLLQNLKRSRVLPSLVTTIPLLFCTGIFVPSLVFFPYQRMKKRPELTWILIMAILMILPLCLEPINKIWHTGSYQCFPARYGYITSFLMLMTAACSLAEILRSKAAQPAPESVQDSTRTGVRMMAASVICVACVALLAAFLLPYMQEEKETMNAYTTGLWGDAESFRTLGYAAAAVSAVYLIVLALGRLGWLHKGALAAALLGVLLVESVFNGGVYMGYPAADQSGYNDILDLGQHLQEQGFYRVKTQRREVEANWMGAAGLPTLSHYTSLTGEDYLFSMKKLGYSAYWMEADSQGGTQFTDALLSNLYTVKRIPEVAAGDTVVYQNTRYALIQNPYRLPSALISDVSWPAVSQMGTGDRFEAQNHLYQSLMGTQDNLFVRYDPAEWKNLTYENGKIALAEGEKIGMITYYIHVEGRKTLYFDCFGGRYTTRLSEAENGACTVMVNNRLLESDYPAKKINGILELGTFEDEEVKIEIGISKNISPASFGVAGLAEETMQNLEKEARGTELEIQGSTVRAYVQNGRAGQTILIPLAYHKGYEARINGEKAQVNEALSGFMSVTLVSGENRIELTYHTPGLRLGLGISVFGLCAAGLLLWKRRRVAAYKGRCYKIAGVLPYLWLVGMIAVIYIMPMVVARGGWK